MDKRGRILEFGILFRERTRDGESTVLSHNITFYQKYQITCISCLCRSLRVPSVFRVMFDLRTDERVLVSDRKSFSSQAESRSEDTHGTCPKVLAL